VQLSHVDIVLNSAKHEFARWSAINIVDHNVQAKYIVCYITPTILSSCAC